jgi:hypothetical protein
MFDDTDGIAALRGIKGVGSVARREPSIRVSIVVPHLGDETAFEDSLISVLENRPAASEVLVAHDGHYSDPFDLGDEVRFVIHDQRSLPQLVSAATGVARGRFVHVLAHGIRATNGWVDAALEKFEHEDAACVSPVARRSTDGPITAAGWTSTASRLMSPVASEKVVLGRRDALSIRGVCLSASFWRKEALGSVTNAFTTDSLFAAQFGWSRLLCNEGWRCLLADQSVVIADEEMLQLGPSMKQGMVLRALDSELKNASLAGSAMSVAIATVSNLLKPRLWGEVAGQTMSLVSAARSARTLQPKRVLSPNHLANDSMETISLPLPVQKTLQTSASSMRRAA